MTPQDTRRRCAARAGSRPTICARFGHRSRMMQMGYAPEDYVGQAGDRASSTPGRDINPCHAHFKQRVEDVKRGVLQAGGFPVELPAISLSRELRQADHHALSQHAGDGDRGADPLASGRRRGADGRLRQDHARPADGRHSAPACRRSIVPAGPMLRGNWHGKMLGSGSDAWKYWDERRAGNITDEDWREHRGRHRALATAPA